MNAIHDAIHAFVQQKHIHNLVGDTTTFADQQYMKAGIIPYIRQESQFIYLLMKPVSKSAMLPPPTFQICKGTRMFLHRGSGWRDMRSGDEEVTGKEALITTALREGIEEVGLILDAIVSIHDVGPYKFISESTGKNKYMWLYVLEISSRDALLPMADIAKTTAKRAWLTADEFGIAGREDHQAILQDIDLKLKRMSY